jgi:hypothetical protein
MHPLVSQIFSSLPTNPVGGYSLGRIDIGIIEQFPAFLASSPEGVAELVGQLLDYAPKPLQEMLSYGTSLTPFGDSANAIIFMRLALGYLEEPYFATLLEKAIQAEKSTNDLQRTLAEIFLEELCKQVPGSFQPRLMELYNKISSKGSELLWRVAEESWKTEFRNILEGRSSTIQEKQKVMKILVNSRNNVLLKLAFEYRHLIRDDTIQQTFFWQSYDIEWKGMFSFRKERIYPLYSEACYHFQPRIANYGEEQGIDSLHPTWELPKSNYAAVIGGNSGINCSACNLPTTRLISLDRIPEGIQVSLPRLELITCLSYLGWHFEVLYYKHDENGKPSNYSRLEYTIHENPKEIILQKQEVSFSLTPDRWKFQDYGGRGNRHRLGGEASWVQNTYFPKCPSCKKTMHFLAQLDNQLPIEPRSTNRVDDGYFWGDGGMGYFYWCDQCRVSGVSWQCT